MEAQTKLESARFRRRLGMGSPLIAQTCNTLKSTTLFKYNVIYQTTVGVSLIRSGFTAWV